MQLRVYRSQRPLKCGLALSNGNIGLGAIEIEVDDKGLVGHVTDSTDDLAQFVRARVGATKTTKGASVGNRYGKRGSGCTCHGRLNNWMLDPEQIDEGLLWPRHGFDPSMPQAAQGKSASFPTTSARAIMRWASRAWFRGRVL